MRAMLFGVSPVDPLTLGGVILVICVIAVAAAWGPARRAALVDPVRSLGAE